MFWTETVVHIYDLCSQRTLALYSIFYDSYTETNTLLHSDTLRSTNTEPSNSLKKNCIKRSQLADGAKNYICTSSHTHTLIVEFRLFSLGIQRWRYVWICVSNPLNALDRLQSQLKFLFESLEKKGEEAMSLFRMHYATILAQTFSFISNRKGNICR